MAWPAAACVQLCASRASTRRHGRCCAACQTAAAGCRSRCFTVCSRRRARCGSMQGVGHCAACKQPHGWTMRLCMQHARHSSRPSRACRCAPRLHACRVNPSAARSLPHRSTAAWMTCSPCTTISRRSMALPRWACRRHSSMRCSRREQRAGRAPQWRTRRGAGCAAAAARWTRRRCWQVRRPREPEAPGSRHRSCSCSSSSSSACQPAAAHSWLSACAHAPALPASQPSALCAQACTHACVLAGLPRLRR